MIVFGFENSGNVLNFIYYQLNIYQILFIEDIGKPKKAALEVFISVFYIKLVQTVIYKIEI